MAKRVGGSGDDQSTIGKIQKPQGKVSVDKRNVEKRKARRRSPRFLSLSLFVEIVLVRLRVSVSGFVSSSSSLRGQGRWFHHRLVWDPWRVTIDESPHNEEAKQRARSCFCFPPLFVHWNTVFLFGLFFLFTLYTVRFFWINN